MNKIANYFKEVYNELVNKTSWPTWPELSNSTVVVMVASLIIAVIIAVMDFAFDNLLELVYKALYL